MTTEQAVNMPAKLIVGDIEIDVVIKRVYCNNEEEPILKEHTYRDSTGTLFTDHHKVGRNIHTVTTYECVCIENENILC